MQVLKKGSGFVFWVRYGRIGVDGATIYKDLPKDAAVREFL